MADLQVRVDSVFPDGMSIGAYVARDQSTGETKPQGAPVNTQTVSGGAVTFTGLTEDETYYAVGLVSGAWRRVNFTVDLIPDDLTPTEGLVDGADFAKKSEDEEIEGSWGFPEPSADANPVRLVDVESFARYQGTWNASTNAPTLADGGGTQGHFYKVSVGAARDLGSGSQTFTVGDFVFYSEGEWTKIDGAGDVFSVAGKTGDVELDTDDIDGLGTLLAPPRVLLQTSGRFTTGGAAATQYIMAPEQVDITSLSMVTAAGTHFRPIYLDPADFPEIAGYGAQLRIRAQGWRGSAPNVTAALNLAALTDTGGSAGAGSVVSGSATGNLALSASGSHTAISSEFDVPTAGFYCLGYTLSGTPAASVVVIGWLELVYVEA